MTRSISRRLVWWLATPLVLLALIWDLADDLFIVIPAVTRSEQRLTAAMRQVIDRIDSQDGRILVRDLSIDDGRLQMGMDTVIYLVRDSQQHVIGGDARIPPISVGSAGEVRTVVSVAGRQLRLFARQIAISSGAVIVVVAEPISAGQFGTRFGTVELLLFDFVRLDITLVLVWIAVRIGLRPLKDLREEIEARSPGNLRPVVDSALPVELVPLVATINRLMNRINDSIRLQQQLIANAAHQLRTPITGLNAQLELLRSEAMAAPIASRLTTLHVGVRELSHSANQLLILARAEAAFTQAPKNQAISLDDFAREITAKFFDRALAANIDLGVDAQKASVTANPDLLNDMLSNLIDNAIKYTESGGSITVASGTNEEGPYIEVDDNGRGIPEAERQRVRTRFYRPSDSPGYGSGLGLAIVDEIARLFGAALVIQTGSSGRGTLVRVQFPMRVSFATSTS